jgi:histidine triad (HIT) family protein
MGSLSAMSCRAMPYDSTNAFSKILRGELPCFKIHEDQHTLAFIDLMPQTDGHVLVIPREAAETLAELSEEGVVACIRVVHKLVKAVQQAMRSDGVLVMQVNGKAAGQTVPHVHFHVIPRYEGKVMQMHAARVEDAAKLQDFAAKIREALNSL